nr:hypothetical protein [Klebsiella oxytoca]
MRAQLDGCEQRVALFLRGIRTRKKTWWATCEQRGCLLHERHQDA